MGDLYNIWHRSYQRCQDYELCCYIDDVLQTHEPRGALSQIQYETNLKYKHSKLNDLLNHFAT